MFKTSAITLLTLLLIAGTAVAEMRPFIAKLDGNAHLSPTGDPCVIRNDETGTGEATHLGRYQWQSSELANFCTVPGGASVSGSFTMTAANGEQLTGQYNTVALFDAAGNLVLDGSLAFTGGTGRFASASGNAHIEGIGFFSPGLPFTATMHGTIDY